MRRPPGSERATCRDLLERVAHAGVWASLLGIVAAVSFQKIRSFDYWWHLRTGQLIAETGSVPRVDPYTYTVPGSPWLDVHWLFQLALHGVHHLGGHTGVVLAKLALVGGLVALLAPIGARRSRPSLTVLALALMLLVAGDRIMPRPELPSFVLLAGMLALFERFERTGDAWIYAVVGIQLVWANVHGLFALGIVVPGIYLASELLRPLLGRGELRRDRARRLGSVTVLCALACLANPRFLEAVLLPLEQLQMIGLPGQRVGRPRVRELNSLVTGWRLMTPLHLALVAMQMVLSFGGMLLNWRRLRPSDPLLWGAFLLLALAAMRNLALFSVVATPILVRNLNGWLDARPHPAGRRALPKLGAELALVLVLALVAVDMARSRFYDRLGALREAGIGVMEVLYPIGAAEWIARHRPPGPIAHHMADGGYLIWRLYPDYPVMMDGRLEVFGARRIDDLKLSDAERLFELDERYRFGTVLVKFSQFDEGDQLLALWKDPAWRLRFVDDVAAVFVRVRDPLAEPALDPDDPDLFPPLDEDDYGVADAYRRFARYKFYAALGLRERARDAAEDLRRRYPERL